MDIDELITKINKDESTQEEELALMRHLNGVAEYTKAYLGKLQEVKQTKQS